MDKKRRTIEEIAKEINPVLGGIINCYHKFQKSDIRNVWQQLNKRPLKWVKKGKRVL
ncbi:group II intron maturase-specific domain-containing protein [Flavobacterium sp. WC2429]|uniref:Group II intron maturase-specific domain-containing protein n=1 Tax=Flavobacterium sp. WC2429 TaxID=3234140 RepID=A0AB39WQK8_9FLAO